MIILQIKKKVKNMNIKTIIQRKAYRLHHNVDNNSSLITILFATCLFGFLNGFIVQAGEPSNERPIIQPSDVVFMYSSGTPSKYSDYHGTIVGWGGRPRSKTEQSIDGFKNRVEEAHKRGLKYCGSVDFLVDFGGFIDFRPDSFMDAVSRDLDSAPLRVPWLWDHKHEGHPAYWFCTNNPEYQVYLRNQAERACLAPIDGLHIDDYSGSSASSAYNGGCFCPFCMKGFREYLKKKYSPEELTKMEIEQIESFDYGKFLKSKGITADDYKNRHRSCPLIDEFQTFQNARMIERISDVFEFAERLRGKPLLRSINSSASSPRTLIPSPVIDYFCGEVPHSAEGEQTPSNPVFVYKMVEALGRRQTATASGHDWAWIKAHEKPGFVRTWIAQTYAFGSVFMVPHRQWCYTKELGTHWWNGKTEDFAYLYQFVRERRSLLDETTSLANVALVHSTESHGTIRNAANQLTRANIPYSLVVAGNDELPVKLDQRYLKDFQWILVGNEDCENRLREITGNDKIIRWKSIADLPTAIKNQVTVEGADRIRVSLRYNPDGPVVCHILNQNYELERDDVIPADIRITLQKQLLNKANQWSRYKSATIYSPNQDPVQTSVSTDGETIQFELKKVGLWAIVEL